MSKVPNPVPADDRMTDNPMWRSGYAEGFLDALAVIREKVSDDGGFAERFLEQMQQARRELRTASNDAVEQESAR